MTDVIYTLYILPCFNEVLPKVERVVKETLSQIHTEDGKVFHKGTGFSIKTRNSTRSHSYKMITREEYYETMKYHIERRIEEQRAAFLKQKQITEQFEETLQKLYKEADTIDKESKGERVEDDPFELNTLESIRARYLKSPPDPGAQSRQYYSGPGNIFAHISQLLPKGETE